MSLSNTTDKSKKSSSKLLSDALYTYLPDGVSFQSQKAFSLRSIYFPLCGIDAKGVKSSITSHLGGDIKVDKFHFLTKPVSTADLRQDVRNFFCHVKGKGVVCLTGNDQEEASLEAGMLWHKLQRRFKRVGLEMTALNFVPVTGESIEIMRVSVKNISKDKCVVTPTFCLPVFGRGLANKHDHEHVTSLLHRIEQLSNGICVEPTMVFDEQGHKPNESVYYVLGAGPKGEKPDGTFPTAESFYGEGGNIFKPEAVFNNHSPETLSKEALQGKEAVGAIRFKEKKLAPGHSCDYVMVMGIDTRRETIQKTFNRFSTPEKFQKALEKNQSYWREKTQSIQFSGGDETFNAWMQWVTLQPVLRRIYGCSFLPDHDYGKGGKGWRDIWQDLLSLILIEPENIREDLINNFAGVRIDGSNATIIGSAEGEFIADRNAITRVWMDHGVWPFATLLLYINQTGDYDILLENNTYFRDVQLSRTFEKDYSWMSKQGDFLKDKDGKIYSGTLMEHILIEHLVQFFNVGEHNIIRLEDADWNDGLDMAKERGESVAFTSFYGGNFLALADLLENLSKAKDIEEISLAKEVAVLLDSLSEFSVNYDDAQAKEKFLFENYFPSVQPEVSGEKVDVPIDQVVLDLRKKGNWIFKHVRSNEKITVEHHKRTNSWFNGYYDNEGRRVEGLVDGRMRMTLVGQVFALMSGLANQEDIKDVIKAVGQNLQDKDSGGFRLNTDFNIPHYMDLGRAFGFAYGTKENGAYFSHMIVMYAYALYKRDFVREGYKVIRSIFQMCMDTDKSKIYPGIPEYFDSQGRGYYHYLTGAASWLVLTQLTQVFGVRGEGGDLVLAPKLVKEEFDPKTGKSDVSCYFAGRKVIVSYENPKRLDYGAYRIKEVCLNGEKISSGEGHKNSILIKRDLIEKTPVECAIHVVLDA